MRILLFLLKLPLLVPSAEYTTMQYANDQTTHANHYANPNAAAITITVTATITIILVRSYPNKDTNYVHSRTQTTINSYDRLRVLVDAQSP